MSILATSRQGLVFAIAAVAVAPAALADLLVDQDLGPLSTPGFVQLLNQEFDPARNTEAHTYLQPNFNPGNPVYNFARVYQFTLDGPSRLIARDPNANGRGHAYVLDSLAVSAGVATGAMPQLTRLNTLVPSGGTYYAAFANDSIANPGPYPTIDPMTGSNLRFGVEISAQPYVPQVAQTTVTLDAGSPTIVKTTFPNDPELDSFTSRYTVVPFWIEAPDGPGFNSWIDFLFDAGVQWGIYTDFNPASPNSNTFAMGDFWLSGGNRTMFLPQGVQFYAVLYTPETSGDLSFNFQVGNAGARTHIGIIPAPGVAGVLLLAAAGALGRARRR